jgi:hypothetical protein
MRATEKYRKGVQTLEKENLPKPYPLDNDHVNSALERNGFWWNGKNRQWEKESEKPSTTIFAEKDGSPTGVARLRLMCHPDETDWYVEALQQNPHFKVIEVSDKTYANRHGAGERAYITVIRKG